MEPSSQASTHNNVPPPLAPITPPSQPITPPVREPKYKNVLCIEDEHFIGDLYMRALTKAGYNVKVISDGQEGLVEAKTDTWDIILLDIMVPHISGIEILQQLRDPKQTPQLRSKIIITTNLEQGEATRAAIEQQADAYIVKAEVTPKQLAEFLQSLE